MAKEKTVKSQRVPVKFFVAGIELLDQKFWVDSSYKIKNDKNLKFSVDIDYKLDTSSGALAIIISYTFLDGEIELHTIYTKNSYVIIKSYINALNDENIKQRFLVLLTELSIDHTRGIHAYILKDTFLSKYPLPVIEPKNIGKILEDSANPQLTTSA